MGVNDLTAAYPPAWCGGHARARPRRAHLAALASTLRGRLLRLRERLEQRHLLEPLTLAERRVLELLPTELSLRQIAERLFVSHDTVHTHVRGIYRKLEVHSRSEAVAKARELDLFRA